eukprot:3936064-Rhodomonas_salina.1
MGRVFNSGRDRGRGQLKTKRFNAAHGVFEDHAGRAQQYPGTTQNRKRRSLKFVQLRLLWRSA